MGKNMRGNRLIVLVIWLFCSMLQGAGDKVLRVYSIDESVKIDGKLDEGFYQRLHPSNHFSQFHQYIADVFRKTGDIGINSLYVQFGGHLSPSYLSEWISSGPSLVSLTCQPNS